MRHIALFLGITLLSLGACQRDAGKRSSDAPSRTLSNAESAVTREPRKWVIAPNGSDQEGDGSSERPFVTLDLLNDRLIPGDTVLLREGIYPMQRLSIKARGTADAWITIASYPGETAHIKGPFDPKNREKLSLDEAEDKASFFGLIDIRGARYVRVERLEVSHAEHYGINVWESEHIVVNNCKIHHVWSRGLGGAGRNLVFEGNELSDAVLHNENEMVFRDSDRGFRRYWSAAAATWYRADGSLSADVTWRNNLIKNSWGEGLSALHVDGALIEDNEVSNAYSTLLYIDHSRNVTVNRNRIYNASRDRVRRDTKEVSPGIMFAAEAYEGTEPIMPENLKITNNLIFNTQVGIGFWRDPANKSKLNRYRNIEISNNVILGVSIVPISIKRIEDDGLGEPRNRLSNNLIEEPRYLADSESQPILLILGNPDRWVVEDNWFWAGKTVNLPADSELQRSNGNQFGDPRLETWRLSNGLSSIRPRKDSPLWATKVGYWKK